jgi:hypothetical protein
VAVPSECHPKGAKKEFRRDEEFWEPKRTGFNVSGVDDVLETLEEGLLGDGENVILHIGSDRLFI